MTKKLWETKYEKAEQTIVSDKCGTAVYTIRYCKEFHRDYKNGFIWRVC
jgi:hypothetical protein